MLLDAAVIEGDPVAAASAVALTYTSDDTPGIRARSRWSSGFCARRRARATIFGMTVSHFRFAKSETRDLAERARVAERRLGEPAEWLVDNSRFFTAVVVIAALLAAVAVALSFVR